jgi:hypothetical protein
LKAEKESSGSFSLGRKILDFIDAHSMYSHSRIFGLDSPPALLAPRGQLQGRVRTDIDGV